MSELITLEIEDSLSQTVNFEGETLEIDTEGDDAEFTALPLRGFYLVRHAATKMNAEGLARGQENPKLSKIGRAQAKALGAWFVGKLLASIHTSDLKRAIKTARTISKATGAPITEVSRALRAWDLGELEGRATADVEPIAADYGINLPDKPIPGGESFHDFKGRVLKGVRQTMQMDQGSERAGPVAIVTHSRNMRCVAAWIKVGCPPDLSLDLDVMFGLKIPDAGVMQLKVDDYGRWSYRVLKVTKEANTA